MIIIAVLTDLKTKINVNNTNPAFREHNSALWSMQNEQNRMKGAVWAERATLEKIEQRVR